MSDTTQTAMLSRYFTFGFDHVHRTDGRTYDADTLVCITAEDPRGVMLEMFGTAWCFEYAEAPAFAVRRSLPIVDIIDGPEGRIVTGEKNA